MFCSLNSIVDVDILYENYRNRLLTQQQRFYQLLLCRFWCNYYYYHHYHYVILYVYIFIFLFIYLCRFVLLFSIHWSSSSGEILVDLNSIITWLIKTNNYKKMFLLFDKMHYVVYMYYTKHTMQHVACVETWNNE